jgi:hypothetical protein
MSGWLVSDHPCGNSLCPPRNRCPAACVCDYIGIWTFHSPEGTQRLK